MKNSIKVTVELSEDEYQVDINSGLSVAIPLHFNQVNEQPNHFGALAALSSPMQTGDFIGDTKLGGSCNVNELVINPHCNGTHTETIAHICDFDHALLNNLKLSSKSIAELALPVLIPCVLISIKPEHASNSADSYTPVFTADDKIISTQLLKSALKHYSDEQLQVLAIRTLPNSKTKRQQVYNSDNQPAFFSREAILYLNSRGVDHLVVDIPSIDRLFDDGLMTCHHLFWQVEEGSHQITPTSLDHKTITEMAYFPTEIQDGFYAINIQLPAFNNDAAPSRPVLFIASKTDEVESKS